MCFGNSASMSHQPATSKCSLFRFPNYRLWPSLWLVLLQQVPRPRLHPDISWTSHRGQNDVPIPRIPDRDVVPGRYAEGGQGADNRSSVFMVGNDGQVPLNGPFGQESPQKPDKLIFRREWRTGGVWPK